MTVRTTILGRGIATVASTPVTLVTVPAGHVYLVKHAIVFNLNAGPSFVQLVGTSGAGSIFAPFVYESIATLTTVQFSGFFVMLAGDTLKLTGTTVPVHGWVSGADLVLP